MGDQPIDLGYPQDEQQPRSIWYRISRVVWRPSRAFGGLEKRPAWLAPFIVVVIVTIAYQAAVGPIRMQDMVRALQSNTQLPPEEISRRITNLENQQRHSLLSPQTALGAAFISLNRLVGMLSLAIACWLLVLALGGAMRFSVALSIVSLSSLVAVPELMLKLPLVIAAQTTHISLSLAAFLGPSTKETVVHSVLDATDLFLIWKLFLIGISISFTTGLKVRTIRWLVVALWVATAAVAVLFGDVFAIV